jgi:hypothetical protein
MAENIRDDKLLADGAGMELTGAGFVDTGIKKRSTDAVPIGLKIGSTRTVLVMPNYEGSLDIVRTLTCVARYRDLFTGKLATKFGDEAAESTPTRSTSCSGPGCPRTTTASSSPPSSSNISFTATTSPRTAT